MKLIVVGVDGSPAATAAAREAVDLADKTGASVLFVAAYAPLSFYGEPYFPANLSDELHAARDAADAALAIADEADVPVEAEVLEGHAAAEILHVAEIREADLIVVGSRGLGPISGAFLGSVSRWLLSHANIPVLVVKDRVRVPA